VEFVAIARPVQVTENAFAGEIAKPRRGQGRQMRVGQVGQCESRHQIHPIGLPVEYSRCTIIS
jgi:hypothetical protein